MSHKRERQISVLQPAPAGWPEAMGEAAFQGLLGEIVRTISPHTEADPAALLLQTVAAFGSVIGRKAHFTVEADDHAGNIFVALVGRSARGRKGTSWGYIRELFHQADKPWIKDHVQPGLSTGEGLIQALVSLNDHDRRLLVFEDEFSAVLRVMSRWGNTLSTTLRHAWDGRPLQVMTREAPLRVTDAHVSVIAQITQHDLNRYLGDTDVFNGFANRFLWGCVKRSKLLPHGGGIERNDVSRLAAKLKKSVDFARKQTTIGLSKNADSRWRQEYPRISADICNLVGAATSRAEAQVRRLALIYALMDRCPIVRTKHLEAAIKVWEFCSASARFIFGDRLSASTDNRIIQFLREAQKGLTRTEISHALGRHTASQEIKDALHELRANGLVTSKRVKTRGRTAEKWAIKEIRDDS